MIEELPPPSELGLNRENLTFNFNRDHHELAKTTGSRWNVIAFPGDPHAALLHKVDKA